MKKNEIFRWEIDELNFYISGLEAEQAQVLVEKIGRDFLENLQFLGKGQKRTSSRYSDINLKLETKSFTDHRGDSSFNRNELSREVVKSLIKKVERNFEGDKDGKVSF